MGDPGVKNEFARKSKRMKFPLQTVNKDYGKLTKAVPRRIDMIASDTGKLFGSRAIMTKESTSDITKPTFLQHLILEDDIGDLSVLPDKVIGELKGLVRKGAQDLTQNWANALELTQKAYHVANVRRPDPSQKKAWKQYLDVISHAVHQLSAYRGNGKWRETDPIVAEAMGQTQPLKPLQKKRFFVEIPGESAIEVDGNNMDEIIDQLSNRIRVDKSVTGTKVHVRHRTQEGAILVVSVNGQEREKIIVKQIS